MENKTLKMPVVQFSAEVKNYYPEILTDEALEFLQKMEDSLK